jgi:hypothetical protein
MEAEVGKEVLYGNIWRFFVDNDSSESCAQGQTLAGIKCGQ